MKVSTAALKFEERFYEGLKEVRLPMAFDLIYQEGIRGNHILFRKEDLKSFERTLAIDSRCLKVDRDEQNVEELFYRVLMAVSFSEMYAIVNSCEMKIRHKMYLLYLRFIKLWSDHLKKSLN